jgi:hypothetical protein
MQGESTPKQRAYIKEPTISLGSRQYIGYDIIELRYCVKH